MIHQQHQLKETIHHHHRILEYYFFCKFEKNNNLKKIVLILIVGILLFSCKKENADYFSKKEVIDSLFIVAESTMDTKLKLKIADQVLNGIEKNNFDSISRSKYLGVTRIFYSLNNPKYVKICKLLIANPSEKVNPYEISFYNFLLGNYYYNNANYEDAFIAFSRAEKSFMALNNLEYLVKTLTTKADILTFKNEYITAENLAIKALKISKNLNKEDLKYGCYLTLGNCSNGLNNYNKAVEFYEKALVSTDKLLLNPNHTSLRSMPLVYISNVYRKQKQYAKSIKYAQKGLNSKNLKKVDPSIYSYLLNSLNYSKFKLGEKSSVNGFLETLKIGDSLKFAPIQITSKTYLGEYYLAQKDTIKANIYLKDAQKQAHLNNIFEDELTILKLLSKANPKQTSFYTNRFIQLNDSLQIEERKTRDKFARIEFETDEIITERNSLSEEKKYLTYQILVIVGISILAIIIIVLWFKNNSQKAKTRELLLKQDQQKANEEIYQLMMEQQQKIEEAKNIEKQRISLDLHDSVMGKLTAVRMNLYVALVKHKLAEESGFSKQIDEIQDVEKEIRAIAHNLNSDLFSDNANFIGIVKELFAKIENHSQIHFQLQVSDAVNWDLINNTTKINLYRILQEALQNIEKYAQATTVAVSMFNTDNGELQIEISDDGNGFDVTQKKKGIGLNNMKTRVAELNGKIEIQSAIKKGTKINLIIPY